MATKTVVAALLCGAAAVWAQPAERGAQLYQSQCSYCHGRDGEGGRGPALNRPVLRRAPNDEALRMVIRRGIAEAGMPRTSLSDRETAQVADYVRSLGKTNAPAAVLTGDPLRGEQLWGKAQCGTCHSIDGRLNGGVFGPDLSGIGEQRSPAYLRKALIDPGADRPDGFVRIIAATRDGRRIDGARVNEDSFSVQLRDASGTVHSFWKAELAELRKEYNSSPMPNYKTMFTAAEIDDLVAFLAGLKERRR